MIQISVMTKKQTFLGAYSRKQKESPANRQGILFTFSLFTFPLKRSQSHARRSCNRRQEGREGGYYDLHRYLNDTLLHLHTDF